jgi:hypothetical protein
MVIGTLAAILDYEVVGPKVKKKLGLYFHVDTIPARTGSLEILLSEKISQLFFVGDNIGIQTESSTTKHAKKNSLCFSKAIFKLNPNCSFCP